MVERATMQAFVAGSDEKCPTIELLIVLMHVFACKREREREKYSEEKTIGVNTM